MGIPARAGEMEILKTRFNCIIIHSIQVFGLFLGTSVDNVSNISRASEAHFHGRRRFIWFFCVYTHY